MKDIPEVEFKEKKAFIDGFELVRLQDLPLNASGNYNHSPFNPHRLNFYAILVITEGEVNHLVDFKTHTLQKGDVLAISQGQIHAFDSNSTYHGYLVVFTDTFMQRYLSSATLNRVYNFYNYFLEQNKISNPSYTTNFLEFVQREQVNSTEVMPNIIGASLGIYLMKLYNTKSHVQFTKPDTKNLDYFNHFKLLLEKNYTNYRDAKFYASEISISYKHLNVVCKEMVNTTAKAFIDTYVVLEAKRKLVTTSLSAKEIAFELGFDEPTNFLKYFKKHTKLTPLEFREKTK